MSGEIFFNEEKLTDIDLTSYRSKIAMVSQDPYLFNASILDNLRWVKKNIEKNILEESLDLANCKKFIDALPDKINTIVGERGMKLSGGQRQRISLARHL